MFNEFQSYPDVSAAYKQHHVDRMYRMFWMYIRQRSRCDLCQQRLSCSNMSSKISVLMLYIEPVNKSVWLMLIKH